MLDRPVMNRAPPADDPLDLRRLKCPLPALLTRKALAGLAPGTVLAVLADDPMALVDIPHMCHREGHTLDSVTRHDSHAVFRIRAGITRAGIRPEAAAPEAEAGHPGDPAAPLRGPDG